MGIALKVLRADNTKENITNDSVRYCNSLEVLMKTSLAYIIESNETEEYLTPEHWMRARVLLLSVELSTKRCGKVLHHTNWTRNRTLCSSISQTYLNALG